MCNVHHVFSFFFFFIFFFIHHLFRVLSPLFDTTTMTTSLFVCNCVFVTFETIENTQFHRLYAQAMRLIYAHAISHHLSRDHAPPDFLIQIIIDQFCLYAVYKMTINAKRTTIFTLEQHARFQ